MRKITKESVGCFMANEPFKLSNTEVKVVQGGAILSLFGNDIACRNEQNGSISISVAGHRTKTTMERLNGLPNVRVRKSKGKLYLNGEEWDGKFIIVK